MKNDIIKIIDFGFAVKCNKDTYQKLFCGTPSYMAPEILNKKKYNPYYSDIWSLGVLFYAMIYGKFPFDYNNKEIDDEFDEITEINITFNDDINVNDDIQNIFKRIFILEPKERMKLNEILDILTKDKKISS
jgi:serine/threonine protein kinase